MNLLDNKWSLWFHSPFDNDWSINSYKNLYNFTTLEDAIKIIENIDSLIYEKYMMFLMKDNIKPIWEDKNNKNGGCFSYKVLSTDIYKYSKQIIYLILGNTLTEDENLIENINGISISPKKNFCIFKIWIKNINIINDNLKDKLEDNLEAEDIFNIHLLLNIDKLNPIFKYHNSLY